MAVALKDLIDINLLSYYDEKITSWVLSTIEAKTKEIELTKQEDLPTVGEPGKLYITEDAILTWNKETLEYESIGGQGQGSSWLKF